MTKDHGPSIKYDDLYGELRKQGASKEKAARIANATANPNQRPSVRGGKSDSYENWTRDELYRRAREIGIEGRSTMDKASLIDALRHG